jgi:acyl-CoA synthetase (AMP-forming)/AMP-acid ligase II
VHASDFAKLGMQSMPYNVAITNSTDRLQTCPTCNVAARLSQIARAMPDAPGVIVPEGRRRDGARRYRTYTFRELDDDSDHIALGLRELGVTPGTRLALMVRPGFDFISLVFGLFNARAVAILIDPGMGRKNLLRCLDEAQPQGFIAVPLVHAIRSLLRQRYRDARINVTVGRRWFWGGATLEQVRKRGRAIQGSGFTVQGSEEGNRTSNIEHRTSNIEGELPEHSTLDVGRSMFDVRHRCGVLNPEPRTLNPSTPDDPAAIIFTSGSTGPPKGVLYRHGNFDAQVDEIRDQYGIRPGEIDVACFPLFALFNCAMGVATVVPEMDFSRPATVDPRNIIEPINDLNATQAFASPAVWDRVGRYCEQHGVRLPSLRRVLSAGAPVHADVLRRIKACIHEEGDVHTPYGATEALPVSSIAATEVLSETAARTRTGGGVCVGRRFPGIDWKVIDIADGPIATLAEVAALPPRQIGELIVRGPVVTRAYYRRPDANAVGKIADGAAIWHRMGDVGCLDDHGRFWFCGRLAHRVLTERGPMYTISCEAIFNQHPDVFRSALVGIGPRHRQTPVIIVEPEAGRFPRTSRVRQRLFAELRKLGQANDLTRHIEHFLVHPAFPVDIRHNAKIFREKLAAWAERRIV